MNTSEQRLTLKRYGLTNEDYDDMLAAQGGRCAVCGGSDPKSGWGVFAVDHDHACCPGRRTCGDCVRGLLCFECNKRLGFIEDVEWFDAAMAYLEVVR